MKLTPRATAEGINTPPSALARNIVVLLVGAGAVLAAFFFVVSFMIDTVVDHLDPETETEVFAEWVPVMLESFGEGQE
ncbi:MAG: hypothetical protein QF464_13135, partial [Myxococcota bacterium]|nr:hypothetical protein [Myxococcota bacterium]